MSVKFSREIRARLAWAASFLKRSWEFEDYPIDYVEQGALRPKLPKRFQLPRWRADLINWPVISGLGETKEAAFADAKHKYVAWRASGKRMWRPGSGPGLVFAESQAIDGSPEMRDHFIHNVLGLEWAFVSDESSLWDFHEEESNDELHRQIGEVYGVDVSDVDGAIVCKILARILDEIGTFPEDPILRAIRLGRNARARHILGLPEHSWNPY